MLKKNFVREKLLSGLPVIGTWIVIPSIISSDIIASSGIDFVIIDREHGPISFETAQEIVIACESRSVSPIMRVGDIDKSSIQKALDIGNHGIQIPNVSNLKEAKQVINFSKYPPIGNRGFSPFIRAADYTNKNSNKLINNSNTNTLVVLNIEGSDAIKNLDEILSVNNIDIIFVGLFDLSKELGIPGDIENQMIYDKLNIIVEKASKFNVHIGTIATSTPQMKKFIDIGLKYIVYGVDCNILKNSYESTVIDFKNIIKK